MTMDLGVTVQLNRKLAEITGWEVLSGGVTIDSTDKFIMPANDVEIEAIVSNMY